MILQLDVKGYRSLRDVTWRPGCLNVLIGANGSGKTNLLRALRLLIASAKGKLSEAVQREGGIDAIRHDQSAEKVSLVVKTEPVRAGRPADQALTYELVVVPIGRSTHRVGKELLASFRLVERGDTDIPLKFIERDTAHAVIFDPSQNRLVAPDGVVSDDESFLQLAASQFWASSQIADYRNAVGSWWVYDDTGPSTGLLNVSPVSRQERQVSEDGSNLVSVLHTLYEGDRNFKRELNEAMRAAFGDDFEELTFPPAADHRIQMRARWRSLASEQSAADFSHGTLRFLFLLAVLAQEEIPRLIAIDEPELGLHPRMMSVVADCVVSAAERSQVIIATHSPDFLNALTDAAGDETALRPTVTVTSWEDGATALRQPAAEDLDRWLESYRLGDGLRSGGLESMT